MRRLGYVLALAALWVTLWGSASPANVLSGLAVGALLVVVLSSGRPRRGPLAVRPAAVARLGASSLSGALRSNLLLTREILTPGHRIRASVQSFELPPGSDELVTIISNLLVLTPGTLPLELCDDPPRLLVHILELEPPERTHASIEALMRRCAEAFGTEVP